MRTRSNRHRPRCRRFEHYNEGLQLGRRGNNLEALKRFESATSADPEFALAYSGLAQTHANLGHDAEAEQASRRAVDLSQKLPPREQYLIGAAHARILNDNQKGDRSLRKPRQGFARRYAMSASTWDGYMKTRDRSTRRKPSTPRYWRAIRST